MTLSLDSRLARGMVFCALGIALLSAMDGVIKHLVATNDFLVVTLGRYLFGASFAFIIWMRSGKPALTMERWKAHSLRGVIIAISASSFFWCVSVLPLAELIVICFIAPLMIPFTARLMLGEKIRPRSVIAGLAGFAGVIIAASAPAPGEANDMRMLGIAAALLSAVAYAFSITLLRGRAGKDGPAVIGLLATLIPGAIIALPTVATGELPPSGDLPAFILLGALAAGGMWCLARAYAFAEAQMLAPFEYTALIWAAMIGYFFFAETPQPQLWIGGAVIIAACLWGAAEKRAQPDFLAANTGSA